MNFVAICIFPVFLSLPPSSYIHGWYHSTYHFAKMRREDETVKVVVRIRPLSGDELRNGNIKTTSAEPDLGLIVVRNPKADDREPPKHFTFDHVFDENATQKLIYDSCMSAVVDACLEGFNGTVFAYGQTGSGKTHTMEGKPDPPEFRGVIPNSFQHIFDHIALSEGTHL